MNFKKFFKKNTDANESKENNPINFLTNNKELKIGKMINFNLQLYKETYY